MSKSVWKFPLEVNRIHHIEMPVGAEILDIQVQDGRPCLWALVKVDAPICLRTFIIYGTGFKIEEEKIKYVGTYQTPWFVFHCFEVL